MSDKSYFYTDPLAAAWMAKHFGMRFQPQNYPYEAHCILEIGGDGLGYREIVTALHEDIPIHPDSLHLLDPRVGDVVEMPVVDSEARKTGLLAAIRVVEHIPYQAHTIIQRNGTAFMWPEQEP